MELFRLFGSILVNNDQANKAIKNTTSIAQSAGSKVSGAMKGLGVAVAGAFAVDKIKDFGSGLITASADAVALEAQFEQVFGGLGDKANEAMNAMGKDFGMLPSRIKAPMTQMTAMFKGLGLDTEEAMSTASDAVTLVADASAFYDKSFEDANSALNSFIKGNYEGGESIGLFANETQMASWASENLGVKWKELDEAGKQVARLEFAKAMQENAGATGQAQRESEGFQNVLGNLTKSWTDLMAVVGQPLLEAIIPIMQGATSAIVDITEKLRGFFEEIKVNGSVLEGLKEKFSGAFSPDSINPSGLISGLAGFIPQFLQKGIEMIQGLIQGIVSNLPMITQTVVNLIQTWLQNMAVMYPMLLNAGVEIIVSLLEGIVSALPQIIDAVLNLITTLIDTIITLFPVIINAGVQIITTLIAGIVQLLPKLIATGIQLLQTVIGAIIQNLPIIIEAGISILNALINGILTLLPQLIPLVITLLTTLLTAIIGNLPMIIEAGIQLILALIDGILTMLPEIITLAIQLIIELVGAILANVPLLISAGIEIIIALISGLLQAIPKLISAIPQVIGAIFSAFANVDWSTLGGNIIGGIIAGIKNGAGAIWNAVTGMFGGGEEEKGKDGKDKKPEKNANGTKNFGGGWSVVGEQGRELVKLPSGSRIYNNPESEEILGKGKQGNTYVTINSPKALNPNEIRRQFIKANRKMALE